MPPDPNRAKKFRLLMIGCGAGLLLLLIGLVVLVVYALRAWR